MFFISFLLTLISLKLALPIPFNSPKLEEEIIKVLFNYIVFWLAIYFTYKVFTYFQENKIQLFEICIITIFSSIFFIPVVQFNPILNNLVWLFYPTKLTRAILDDALSIPWAFVIIGIDVTILIILSNFYKKKINNIQKVIHYGLLSYGVLSIMLFFFSHFSYVGSNYVYMSNNIKIIDAITKYYIQHPNIKPPINIKVYDTFGTFEYKTIHQVNQEIKTKNKDHVLMPTINVNDATKLNDWLNHIKLSNLGNKPIHQETINNIKDFNDWAFFSLNFPIEKFDKNVWIGAKLALPPKKLGYSDLTVYKKIENL
jgi:hypothetical protein